MVGGTVVSGGTVVGGTVVGGTVVSGGTVVEGVVLGAPVEGTVVVVPGSEGFRLPARTTSSISTAISMTIRPIRYLFFICDSSLLKYFASL